MRLWLRRAAEHRRSSALIGPSNRRAAAHDSAPTTFRNGECWMNNSAWSAALALVLGAFASTAEASDIYNGPVVPPFEVVTSIRSMGLEPAGPAVRRGPVYVIRA